MNPADTSEQKTRLPQFRALVRVVAVATGLFYGLFVFFLKDSLPSLRYSNFVIWALLAAAVYTLCITLLEKHLRWKKVFYISNFGWMAAYASIVYGTGGANSPYLFILLIPLITSAWDLDPIITRRVGIIMLAIATLMIFADPSYVHSAGFVFDFFLRINALGIIMYYIYRLLKETLLQKYDKEEAKRKYDELVEIDRLKTDFIDVVSHQLRTPLTGARWSLSAILEREDISPTIKELLKQTEERIVTAISIVHDMIHSIHSESDAPHKIRDTIQLDALIGEIVTKLQYFISGNHVSFSFGHLSPCSIKGNGNALAVVFSNIIDNAVRYSPGGKVLVDISCDDSKATVVVTDSGIGIPEGDQEYIFKRFYRSKNAVSVEPNGSGLGLYISKRIIEQHGGSISFTSELGKGTSMTITLPRDAAEKVVAVN